MATSNRTDELYTLIDPPFVDKWEEWNKLYPLTANEPVSASSPWVGTALTGGTFAMTTAAQGGEAIQSAAATTDNTGNQVQDDVATFNLPLGAVIDFKAKVKMSDITESEVYAGLAVIDTTLLDGTGTLAGGLTHTGSIGFYKPDGEANWYGVVRVGSVNVITVGPIASPVAATYDILKFHIEMHPTTAAQGTIEFWVNGKSSGRCNSTGFAASSVFYARSWAVNSGSATGTVTSTSAYIGARQSY